MNDQFFQDQYRHTAKYINLVGLSLFRELASQSNLVFSPLGIYCVLRILYEGAAGETRKAISQLLYLDSEPVSIDGLKMLLEDQLVISQVLIANGIWIQDGYDFKSDFLNNIQTHLLTEAFNLDIDDHPRQASAQINAWVAEKTNGRISEVISPEYFSSLTRGILANVLYFKASWEREFADPQSGTFYLYDGTQIEVPLMSTYYSFNYIQQENYWAIELPYLQRYRSNSFSMILYIPTSSGIKALNNLGAGLTKRDIFLIGAQKRLIVLTMPPFKIHGNHSLVPILANLGLDEVFTHNADFSGLSGELGFHINKLLQNCYILVDQYGTEAAAVTYSEYVGGGIPPRFIIDRPFLYVVINRVSGLILFMGKVLNPIT